MAFAGVALALTGCGQAAEQAAEEAAEQAIEAQGGGDVEIDAEGGEFSVEGEDGSEFSVGSDELPDDFPADVPIPEGAHCRELIDGEDRWQSGLVRRTDLPRCRR